MNESAWELFWRGREHDGHRDAPGWVILVLILVPSVVIILFGLMASWLSN